MSDLRAAVRALVKSPGFSLVAILTIAVGIGASGALFSVYDRLVLHPVTIEDPSSLVAILSRNPQLGAPFPAISWPRYEEGLTRFVGEVLPLVEQSGLRKPHRPQQQRSA